MSSVDIVVPCYNYGHFLERCVESVLDQDGVDLRVLIIDDASSDDTPRVGQFLASRDPRVTFRRHAANQGHIATYNEGLLGWASAPYSLLISADDALAPGALARATRIMNRHRDVGMAYGMALTMGEDGSPTITQPSTTDYQVIPGLLFLEFCCKNFFNPVPTPTAVVRTEVQHQLGGYKSEFPHTGDLEMWMRFAVHGPIAVLRQMQGYYRWHGRNMARRYYDQVIGDRRELVQTYEQVLAPLGKRVPASEKWLRDMPRDLERQAFLYAANAFDRGERAEYLAWLEFASEIAPSSRRRTVQWGLKIRQLMGQTVWHKMLPGLNRIRGRPVTPWQGPRFNPSPGDQIGWWPEPAMRASVCSTSRVEPTATRMDVSLIICTRDRSKQLGAHLESLRRITFDRSWELILVDNGSVDGTANVIQDFIETVSIPVTYVFEPVPGLGTARNAGLNAARGEIAAFTDDDCYPAEDFLTRLWAAFADPSVGYVTGRIMLHDPRDFPITINESPSPRTFAADTFLRVGDVQGANMAFRSQVLLDIGGFDPLFGSGSQFSIEDLDAAARASAIGWVGQYRPDIIVRHHHRRKRSDVAPLKRAYAVGRGAYHMKLLLKQRRFEWFARSVYELWRARIIWDRGAPLWETIGAAEYAYVYFSRALRARLTRKHPRPHPITESSNLRF